MSKGNNNNLKTKDYENLNFKPYQREKTVLLVLTILFMLWTYRPNTAKQLNK